MAHCSIAQRGLLYALALAGLAACTSTHESNRIDYKTAGAAPVHAPSLEVPPDLTRLQHDNRYAIPDAESGTATATGFNAVKGVRTGSIETIAPSIPEIRVERSGNQRWLVVKQAPEVLWPQIKDFWTQAGFVIHIDTPDIGVMETDWAENRAKIPQDFIRNTVGKLFDSLYSTGERDKFRTRLERAADGTTEIYISHRGAQEVANGQLMGSTVWTPRASDPELEAEFLSRLMMQLGVDKVQAKSTVVNAVPQSLRAKLVQDSNGRYMTVDESFDRAWRRVGLALDRIGFTVEDRDRSKGLYFVHYIDQGKDVKKADDERGFFSKLFFGDSKDTNDKTTDRYRVFIKEVGGVSQIAVFNNEGKVDASPTAEKILTLLNDQLK